MEKKLKVYITSCETDEGGWRRQETMLKALHAVSDQRYLLTEDPQAADVILIGNVRRENWGETTLKHPLIRKFPDKCFSLSDQDMPRILNRGIYTSGEKSLLGYQRVRSGSYLTYGYTNSLIEKYEYCEADHLDKRYLLSFIGRFVGHSVRTGISKLRCDRDDILIEDSNRVFDLWDQDESKRSLARQNYYCEVLLKSKFSLCPRGNGSSSYRLFESLKLGVAPVIVSDAWIPPSGPRWQEFSIFIKEKHLAEMEQVVRSHEAGYAEMGRLARRAYEQYFCEEIYFNYVVDSCLAIRQEQMIPEALYQSLNPFFVFVWKMRESIKLRSRLKKLIQA